MIYRARRGRRRPFGVRLVPFVSAGVRLRPTTVTNRRDSGEPASERRDSSCSGVALVRLSWAAVRSDKKQTRGVALGLWEDKLRSERRSMDFVVPSG